jgi:hypothetical protein
MKLNDSIVELENLSENSIYKRDKIEWWLLKYDEVYKYYYNDKETRSKMKITYRADASSHRKESIDLLNKINVFLDTYEVLDKVSEFYRNELYFKDEVVFYKSIKDDIKEQNSWLEIHELGKVNKYDEFISLFQNTSKSSGYEFEILYPFSLPLKIRLDESEFKYTLKFLEILKSLKKMKNGSNRKN